MAQVSAEQEIKFLTTCGMDPAIAERTVNGLRGLNDDELKSSFLSAFKVGAFDILWKLNRLHEQRIRDLRLALISARGEINRWGHGDMHYGPMPRDPGVVTALAAIDEVLGQ